MLSWRSLLATLASNQICCLIFTIEYDGCWLIYGSMWLILKGGMLNLLILFQMFWMCFIISNSIITIYICWFLFFIRRFTLTNHYLLIIRLINCFGFFILFVSLNRVSYCIASPFLYTLFICMLINIFVINNTIFSNKSSLSKNNRLIIHCLCVWYNYLTLQIQLYATYFLNSHWTLLHLKWLQLIS